MNAPTVSVIIPAYNRAKLMRGAIESVLAQTFRDFELIVVDDGSTDNTLEVLKEWGDQIRVISQKNGGCGAAKNTGARAARGELIAFLDTDDLWLPDCLSHHVSNLADSTVAVSAVNWALDETPTIGAFSSAQIILGGIVEEPLRFLCRDQGHRILPSSMMIRRSVMERIGWHDERLRGGAGEDTKLLLRAAFEGKFAIDTSIQVVRASEADDVKLTRAGNFKYDCISTLAALECFSEAYYKAASLSADTRKAVRRIRARLLHASAKQAAKLGDGWLARRRYLEALVDGLRGRRLATALIGLIAPKLRT